MSDRFHFLVAVHAFFLRDSQILLCERANTGYMDGFLSVPAGHADGGESIWEAMQRESVEEVGVTLSEEHAPSHVMHRVQEMGERIDYFYVIKKWDGEPSNCEPDKCAHVAWYNKDALPETVVPYIKFAFEHIEQGKMFSEFTE